MGELYIRPLEVTDAPNAIRLLEQLTRDLPHQLILQERDIVRAVTKSGPNAIHRRAIAFVKGSALLGLGASYVCKEAGGQSHRLAQSGDGVIPWLFCNSSGSGEALASSLLQHLEECGVDRIVAFDPGDLENSIASFNGGFPGLPENLPISPRVLSRCGFRIATRELHLTLSSASDSGSERVAVWAPNNCPLPDGVSMKVKVGGLDESAVRVFAEKDGRQLGSAWGRTVESREDGAGATGYITWLGVDQAEQRRGIGRALLSQIVSVLAGYDCRRVFLTTGSQNWGAQSLYFVSGFQVVGTSVGLVRTQRPTVRLSSSPWG